MKHISKRYSLQDLEKAVVTSFSIRQVLEKIGLAASGGNHSHLKQKIEALNLDTRHFLGQAARRKLDKTWSPPSKRELKDILKKGTIYNNQLLKQRLIKQCLLVQECSKCGLGPEWNGTFLALHLDHKNGDKTDNRIDNLRILCPNCHSQTSTYAGKGKRKITRTDAKPVKICSGCYNKIGHKSKTGRCVKCSQKHSRKVERPTKEILKGMINKDSWTSIGRQYGVSDNAVRKWARSYGII